MIHVIIPTIPNTQIIAIIVAIFFYIDPSASVTPQAILVIIEHGIETKNAIVGGFIY